MNTLITIIQQSYGEEYITMSNKIKVGINGFGRIARVILRSLEMRDTDIEICGVNLHNADFKRMAKKSLIFLMTQSSWAMWKRPMTASVSMARTFTCSLRMIRRTSTGHPAVQSM